ncbi:MAG: phenylacetate--CoA ligase family protein [Acidobacteria bacterium]|nr:phenylacetate--CoA ligase family protein [Acidobacteriota bacterium]
MKLSDALWRLSEWALNHPMRARLAYLDTAQWWDLERIRAEQRLALDNLFKHLHEHPAWAATYIQLDGFPLCGKSDLNRIFSSTPKRRGMYAVSSSGSTGTNTRVWCDLPTAARYRACFMLALQWAGWKIGEPHIQTGMNVRRGLLRRAKDTFLRTSYVSCLNLTDNAMAQTLSLMEKRRIQHLWGYPAALWTLAQFAQSQGWNIPLKTVISWGDNLYGHYREKIETVFRCRIHDTYGIGEGVQIAAQCGEGNHYHIHALDVVLEAVGDDDHPVPVGTLGHGVVTRLHPGPMPLVRYKMGDLVRLSDESCPCGRGLPLMQAIEGRDTDLIVTPSGKVLIVHFFTGILEYVPWLDSFQIHQNEPDELLIQVKPISDWQTSFETEITQLLRDHGLTDMRLVVENVEQFSVSPSGKRRFVVNHLAPTQRANLQQS